MVDFNVNPMKWALGHYIDGKLYIFDEVVKYDTNTPEMAKETKRRYPNSFFFVYGDYTGGKRDTRSYTTDYELIKQELLLCDMKLKPNPHVIDRINAVNGFIRNSYNEVRLYVDERCQHVIKDFEQVMFIEHKREINKNFNPDLTHISDAIGYYIEYEHAIAYKKLYSH
jgi:hypothetical protein